MTEHTFPPRPDGSGAATHYAPPVLERMTARHPPGYEAPVGLAADPVVFTLVDGDLSVLLARRLEEPQRGTFALPGGFVGAEESARGTGGRRGRRRSASCARRPGSAPSTSSSCAPTHAPTATRAAGCPRSPTSR